MPSEVLVISTYPTKNTTHTGGGLAIYTKNTLIAIKKADPKTKITVLANIIDKKEEYYEKGIKIIRCWDRSFSKLYPPLFREILKVKTKNIFFCFEFSAYGDLLNTGMLSMLLILLKICGKNIVSVIHQVIPNLAELSTHTGVEKKSKIIFYNKLLIIFFNLLGFASHKVVTLEQLLAERFNKITHSSKAISIPHGLYPKTTLNQRHAQAKLNLSYHHLFVLCFGYLSHYKGSDIIVEAFKKPIIINKKQVKLILAGGENPTQGQKGHYKHYYQELYKNISDNSNIIHTGFVPDKKVKEYFSAADLVVFPYRTFMSASGPLSLAISHKKPFLVSSSLKNYSNYTFKNNPSSIRKSIIRVLKNKILAREIASHSQNLVKHRNFNNQGHLYLETFSN